jgi:hypothetical protein
MTVATCPNCHAITSEGAPHCPVCGQLLDAAVAAEIYELYATLQDLDARIAAGQGGEDLLHLREAYRMRYLEQHGDATSPEQILEQHWLYRALQDLDARILTGASALTVAQLREAYVARYVAIRVGPRQAERRAPTGPAFSWSAFLKEGAIALMAYLGGFLLIVAAFTLVIGSWGSLDDGQNLALVVAVHLFFLGLGIGFRQTARPAVRTVGSAYLAVFALMVPVVALAVYRFALQGVAVPLAGVICVAAAYGMAIYLLLGWTLRQPAYGYLAWVALCVALEGALGWSGLPSDWWIAVLALGALILLVPGSRVVPLFDALAPSARQVTLAGTAVAGGGWIVLFAGVAFGDLADGASLPADWTLAALVTGGTLLALAAGWSVALRLSSWQGGTGEVTAADLGVSGSLATLVVSAGLWLHLSRAELAYLLAGLACLWVLAVVTLRTVRSDRTALRHGLAATAAGIPVLGAALVAFDVTPNWPLAACLSAGVAVGVLAALANDAPWWLLGSGFFLMADFAEALAQFQLTPLAASLRAVQPALDFATTFYAVLVLVLFVAVVACSAREPRRRYALPIYIVALAGAVLTSVLLPFSVPLSEPQPVWTACYGTAILAALAAGALVAGWRTRRLLVTQLAYFYLGLLLPLPCLILDGRDVLPVAALAVGVALVALGVRWRMGRSWAHGPYAVAVWITVLTALQAASPVVGTAGWSLAGVSLASGILLAGATLATIAAWWERHHGAMAAPAALALLAVVLNADALGRGMLVYVIVVAGVLVRWRRGAGWGWAWLAAAVPAVAIAAFGLYNATGYGPWYVTGLLVGLAALSGVVATVERTWWVGSGVLVFGAGALAIAAQAGQFLFSLVVTGGAAVIAVVVRVVVVRGSAAAEPGRRTALVWTAPWYGLAAAGSIAAAVRSGVSPVGLPVALLGLAGLAYLVAVVERSAWITVLAVVYGVWAAAVLPGAHPLVLTMGVALSACFLGAGARLLAGRAWAPALYTVAVGASLLSLVRAVPYDVTTMEVVLLVYALAACLVVAAERNALVGLAPALYASGAVVIEPETRLVLVVALVAVVIGVVLSKWLASRWAWPWYMLAGVAGLAAMGRALTTPHFEPVVLFALALLVYVVAAGEKWAWALMGAFALVAGALADALAVGQASQVSAVLAFSALGYVIAAGHWLWMRLMPEEATPDGEESDGATSPAAPRSLGSGRLGVMLHGWGGIGVGALAAILALSLTPQGSYDPNLLSGTLSLLALGGLLWLQSNVFDLHVLQYFAGLAAACSLLWVLAWLGVDNPQPYVLVSGVTLIVCGLLLPRDKRLGYPTEWGAVAVAAGSLMMLFAAFVQTFTPGQELAYLALLILEALALMGVGLGASSRTLIISGASAVGVAALRGAALAIAQGAPVFIFIACVAVVLLGGATWLSVRTRDYRSGDDLRPQTMLPDGSTSEPQP